MPRDLDAVPPSRWRVVERDRRLEVIDTRTGERLAPRSIDEPAPPAPATGGLRLLPTVQRTRFDGGGDLATHRLYDLKAPRTIRLDPGSAEVIGRVQFGLLATGLLFVVAVIAWPWLLALLVLPAQAKLRQPVRRWIAEWLDRVEREAS